MYAFIYSILVILITDIFIVKAYEYYKLKWPDRYFGPDDKANIFISTNALYYITFRLFPVFILILVTHGVAYNASIDDKNPLQIFNPIYLGVMTAFFYSITIDGRAIYDIYRNSTNIEIYLNKTKQYFLHIVAIPTLSVTGGIAGYLTMIPAVGRFLPKLDGLVDNIWASFMTIILFYIAKNFINKPKEVELDEIVKKSAEKINHVLISLIETMSSKYQADPILVKSVCIAENIQRPSWVRKIENIFGIFSRTGTYGIMQVASNKPISDEESIEIAIKKFFAHTEKMDFSTKMKTIEAYHNEDKYMSLIEAIYNFITPV